MSLHTASRFARLLLVLVTTLVFSSLATAQSNAVRIMPLGDSITGSPGCWRALLWSRLQQAGFTDIDFVGTQPPQGCSVPHDGNNEGHGGALATMVADQNQLPAWLAATNPDIVMMHFGTNDVWSNRSPTVILTAFSKLVDQMRANNPDMMILVAQIIPVNPSTCADCAQRTIDFNAAIPAWAASKSTTASPIVVVDQWTGFNSATDTSEGVHPNALGDQKIADKWFPALTALLLGNPVPPLPGFSLTANPPVPAINPGASGTSTIGVFRFGGFASPVDLSATPPAGWSVSFSPDPAPGNSSVMTIAVPAAAVSGIYPITVTGTAAGAPSPFSVTVTASVSPQLPSDFTIVASVGNQTITRGATGTNTITIQRINSFTGSVDLNISALPAGVMASFNPDPTTANASTLTFTVAPAATLGTFPLIVSGVGTPGTRTSPINLTVVDVQIGPCANPLSVSLPFSRDGVGEFCVVTSGTIDFVNSFNMRLVEINGVNFTNLWSNVMPPRINGNYTIHGISDVPWAHFEATGTGGGTTNTLAVAPASLAFAAAGGSAIVAVTSNVSWTATSNQPWLSVTPASGTNNGSLTITGTANAGLSTRSGVITLFGGGITRTVAVSQGFGPSLTVVPATLSFPATASSAAMAVTSNVASWTITDDQPWLSVTPASGSNIAFPTVSAVANTGTTARTGTITVTGGGITGTIAVTQAGATPTNILTVAPTTLSFAAAAGSSAVAITSNVSWSITDDQTWITVTPASGANNATPAVAIAANTSATARTGTVTVTGGGLTRMIAVTQAGVTGPTPCANPTPITLPFARNGVGDFCFVTSGNIGFINSWNMQLLEVNGVNLTGLWRSGADLPPRINGNYFIHYVAIVPFAHFEASGSP